MVANPFASPAEFVTIPRLGGLLLSPDGTRLVTTIAETDRNGAAYVNAVWAIDPDGQEPARRLTRSSEGESAVAFLPDGSLLFTSRRPRPDADRDGDDGGVGDRPGGDRPALWVLPAQGGDPWVALAPPGGVSGVATGRATTTVVASVPTAPGGGGDGSDAWWARRRDRKVGAVLHESLPIRLWDHHIGPDEVHLCAFRIDGEAGATTDPVDLTPDAGQALIGANPVLTPDGRTVVTDWQVPFDGVHIRSEIVAVDVATGERRTLVGDEAGAYSYTKPKLSPDGTRVVVLRESRTTVEEPGVLSLWLVDVATGDGREVPVDGDAHLHEATFDGSGRALIVEVDLGGRQPLLWVDLESGGVTRLTGEGAWASVQAGPPVHAGPPVQAGPPEPVTAGVGGAARGAVYALRSSPTSPPQPVRLDLPADDGAGVTPAAAEGEDTLAAPLPAPGRVDAIPGRLEELRITAADGQPLRAWLALPDGASASDPAPLVVWVHGGPLSSWNDWHWRWNPWVMASRGWAVLLPDPALSTGYGLDFIRRGWSQWGGAPYDDVMAVTDAALERPDLDGTRTAAMGGSYGGYMANWIAGHTGRFQAIVSHASLWSLEQFQPTTDDPGAWTDMWGSPDDDPHGLYRTWSPDRYADEISTPMLVIHGNNDYRCPVSESIRLWTRLCERGVPAKFLWFPNENHWILEPGDAVVWYETVLAWLDHHVLGRPWARPELL